MFYSGLFEKLLYFLRGLKGCVTQKVRDRIEGFGESRFLETGFGRDPDLAPPPQGLEKQVGRGVGKMGRSVAAS